MTQQRVKLLGRVSIGVGLILVGAYWFVPISWERIEQLTQVRESLPITVDRASATDRGASATDEGPSGTGKDASAPDERASAPDRGKSTEVYVGGSPPSTTAPGKNDKKKSTAGYTGASP